MEKKLIWTIFAGLLIGLLVGVALGYVVAPSPESYQRQINNLQTQINDLQNQIAQKNSQIQALQEQVSELETLLGPIRKGAWNLIKSFEGASYSINTEDFLYC